MLSVQQAPHNPELLPALRMHQCTALAIAYKQLCSVIGMQGEREHLLLPYMCITSV